MTNPASIDLTAAAASRLPALGVLLRALLAVPLCAALLIAALPLRTAVREVRTAEATLERLDRTLLLADLVHHLQRERGLSGGLLTSHGTHFATEVAEQRRLVDRAAAAARGAQTPPHTIEPTVLALRAQIDRDALSPLASFSAYTEPITALLDQADGAVAQEEDARVAGELAALSDLSHAKEYAGQERATANRACTLGRLERPEFDEILRLGALQEGLHRRFHALALPAWAALLTAAEAAPFNQAALRLRALIVVAGPGGPTRVEPEVWWATSTARIDGFKAVEDEVGQRIHAEVAASSAHARWSAWLLVSGIAALLILSALGGLQLVRAIRGLVAADVAAREATQQEIRRLTEALATTREQESGRLADALQDGAAQSLTGVGLRLFELEKEASPARALEVQKVQAVLASVIDDLRGLSHGLRPAALDRLGLAAALEDLATTSTSPTCRFEVRVSLAGVEPAAETATALFRIAQDAVGNVLRHSKARAGWITLAAEDDLLRLEVEDDGEGFDSQTPGRTGLGMVGMRERVGWLGGAFAIRTSPGGGTRITVEIPLASAGQRPAAS